MISGGPGENLKFPEITSNKPRPKLDLNTLLLDSIKKTRQLRVGFVDNIKQGEYPSYKEQAASKDVFNARDDDQVQMEVERITKERQKQGKLCQPYHSVSL